MGKGQNSQNPKALRQDLSLSFRSKSLKSINAFPLCVFVGRCGVPYFWHNRNGILYICQVATFLSMVCTIFGCLSIGVSQSLTKVGAWTTGTGDIQGSIPTTTWVGLSGAVWRSQTGDVFTDNYVLWEDTNCFADTGSQPYCDNCNSAGNSAVGLVLLAAVTRIPSILLLQSRMLEKADEPLFKTLGFISESLAFCCFAGATFVWREYCHKQLPFQNDMDYGFGGGFILVGLGMALTCCIAITHAAMPCEAPGRRRPIHNGPKTGSASNRTNKDEKSRQSITAQHHHNALDATPPRRESLAKHSKHSKDSTPASASSRSAREGRGEGRSSRGSGYDRGDDDYIQQQQQQSRDRSGSKRDKGRPKHSSPYVEPPIGARERNGDIEAGRFHAHHSHNPHQQQQHQQPYHHQQRRRFEVASMSDVDDIGITLGGETERERY
jgi:hypothetical protein